MHRVGSQIGQTVKGLAVDQRPQPRTDMDIGRRFARCRLAVNPYRIVRPGHGLILGLGVKPQHLRLTLPFRIKINRQHGRVIDDDTDLFDGGDKVVFAVFDLQNRREQLDQRRTANRGAFVKPCAIAGDAHVDVAAERRVPEMHRRRPLFRGRPHRGKQAFCGGFHDDLSSHAFCRLYLTP